MGVLVGGALMGEIPLYYLVEHRQTPRQWLQRLASLRWCPQLIARIFWYWLATLLSERTIACVRGDAHAFSPARHALFPGPASGGRSTVSHASTSDPIGVACSKYLGSDRSRRISCRTWVRDRRLRGRDGRHALGGRFRSESVGGVLGVWEGCRTHRLEHPPPALRCNPLPPLRSLHPLVPKHLERRTSLH